MNVRKRWIVFLRFAQGYIVMESAKAAPVIFELLSVEEVEV